MLPFDATQLNCFFAWSAVGRTSMPGWRLRNID